MTVSSMKLLELSMDTMSKAYKGLKDKAIDSAGTAMKTYQAATQSRSKWLSRVGELHTKDSEEYKKRASALRDKAFKLISKRKQVTKESYPKTGAAIKSRALYGKYGSARNPVMEADTIRKKRDDELGPLGYINHGVPGYLQGRGVAAGSYMGGIAGGYAGLRAAQLIRPAASRSSRVVPNARLLSGPNDMGSRIVSQVQRLKDAPTHIRGALHSARALLPGMGLVGGAYAAHKLFARGTGKALAKQEKELGIQHAPPQAETSRQRMLRRGAKLAGAAAGAYLGYKASKPITKYLHDKATLGGRLVSNPSRNPAALLPLMAPGAAVGVGALAGGKLSSNYVQKKQQRSRESLSPSACCVLREVSDETKLRAFHTLYTQSQKAPLNPRKLRQLTRFSNAASGAMRRFSSKYTYPLSMSGTAVAVLGGLYGGYQGIKRAKQWRKQGLIDRDGMPTKKKELTK